MKIKLLTLAFLIVISCENKKNMNLETKSESNDSLKKVTSKDSFNSSNFKINEKIKESDKDIDFEELGFALMEQETLNDLKLGLNKKQVEEKIGVASEFSENEIWDADGEYHQTYFYKNLGIELDMIGDNLDTKKVNMITIYKPCKFKTSSGIAIGSKLSELEGEYGKYYNKEFSDKENFVAGSIYGGVIFTLKNNEVESIFIGVSAE